MKKQLFVATIIFIFSFILGFLFLKGVFLFDEPEIIEVTKPNFFAILFNNCCVCIFLILGVGIITVPLGAYQGLQLGAMLSIWLDSGSALEGYALLTLPHCVFEIPALLISIALGLYSGKILLDYYHNKKIDLKKSIIKVRNWLISVPLLLIIAALIETFITGNLYNNIMF